MSEKRVLKDDELTKVSGGASGGEPTFTGHVGKYDGIVENYYYIVNDDDHNIWYYGVLKKTWEDKGYGFLGLGTKRFHRLEIRDWSKAIKSVEMLCWKDFNSDDWTLYTNKS